MVKKILREFFDILRMVRFRVLYPKIKCEGIQNIHKGTELLCHEGGQLSLGDKVSTCRGVSLGAVGGKLVIGERVFFNRNSIIACRNYISIGSGCLFGPNVMVYDHDHKYDEHGCIKNEYNLGSIIIDEECWIGASVIILKDTHIGKGSIIGAGTIVKGDIPPYSIVKSQREMIIRSIKDS